MATAEISILKADEVLTIGWNNYKVEELIDSGHFGDVFKCWNISTKQNVAIKIAKTNNSVYKLTFERETSILSMLNNETPHNFNMVRTLDSFSYNNHGCLVFEFLDQNLHNFIKQVQRLELNDIKKILQQVLVALQKLKEMGITHADLKPQNIMLVDHLNEPFRIKVIDFGNAVRTKELNNDMYQKTLYYRAPEVMLGLPINESIDMWSLGCIAAELFLGHVLYCGKTEYDQLRSIYATQGLPKVSMLNEASRTEIFFNAIKEYPHWRLKEPYEYEEENQITPTFYQMYSLSLDDIAEFDIPPDMPNNKLFINMAERTKFVGLLKQMLDINPKTRITPSEALRHLLFSNGITIQKFIIRIICLIIGIYAFIRLCL